MIERKIFTVTQLSQYLKNLLWQDSRLQDIWISGEISNYKLHEPSGHIYFTLKDEQSVLRSVFFRGKNSSLKFIPAEGMKVLARGSITLYERSGYFQLFVEELEPDGLGALFLAFEQLKKKLFNEGLFKDESKKPLPRVPRKIGLITSPSGAAVKDFLITLERRFPCVQVYLYPVAVQGREAPEQICSALKALDAQGEVDVIVITRGGGSLEELWCFNDETVARSIYQLKTPVVTAIGHETDYTIVDFVADKRASTPTAAAEIIAPERSELIRYLSMQEQLLGTILSNNLHKKRTNLEKLTFSHAFKQPQEKINTGNQRLDELCQRLKRSIGQILKNKNMCLDTYVDKLKALDPLQVLSRGYTLTVDRHKQPLKSINDVQIGGLLKIIFYDGEAYCRVEKICAKEG